MGPLATHGFRSTSLPLQGIGALGRGEGAARGIRGITAVAPPNASLLAGGPRGRGVYAGGVLPRRQRHKVSSKDLTEEQRNERRWVSVLRSVLPTVSPSVIYFPFLSWWEFVESGWAP